MSERAKALIKQVDRLITLPSVYFDIRRIIESPTSDIIEVARTISTDVALTARLLRIVNSPAYAQSRPVVTVSRAVSMLGMNQIHDLCLAACLATTFSRIRPRLMDVATYWRQSVLRGTTARVLARQCRVLDLERLFILGLLADIGHMVIYMRIPEEAALLVGLPERQSTPLHAIEREHLQCDHAEVGSALLAHWHLPEGIWRPISEQTAPRPGEPHALESALLNLIAAALQAREAGGNVVALASPAAWEITGITPEQLAEALLSGEEAIDGLTAIFAEQMAA